MSHLMYVRLRQWFAVLAFFVAVTAGAKEAEVSLCERALVPDVNSLNLVEGLEPQPVRFKPALSSPAMVDPWLRLGRRVVAFPDFKFISDLQPTKLSPSERRDVILKAKKLRRRIFGRLKASGASDARAVDLAQKAYARYVINHLFRFRDELTPLSSEMAQPRWQLKSGDPVLDQAFKGVEETWGQLTRRSPEFSDGSLLPSPYPVVVAGGRFRESYYWDAYFGALGLIATGRRDLAAAQLENFLHMIQVFGRVPNGFRDYYLSRSQPPVISMMALAVFEDASKTMAPEKLRQWLSLRVFPLLRHDYHEFWMKQRFDARTGLNFYSDDLNLMRPERHANDDDRELGDSFRDVRAQAESGLDHTDALMSDTASVASVSLNAFLYRYELDLARMAEMVGQFELAQHYRLAAEQRRLAINRYLWDESSGMYRNYSVGSGRHSSVVHSDQFAMLYVGAASKEQAASLEKRVLGELEKAGGLGSSSIQSGKQWDGDHGWAPLHVMAIQGLADYGHRASAERLARKWVNSVAKTYAQTGAFLEKIDVGRVEAPVEDGSKYPTQTGFLWTNASFVWACRFLGLEFTPL